jgi:phospholipase/carboxylesterase
MSPTPLLTGPDIAPQSGNAKRLVIFLHGLGADGNDLISLAPMLDLPDTHFLSPNAPYPCDMAPYGYQWFSLRDRNPPRMLAEIEVAAPILQHYIDHHLARLSITPEHLALVGFSQGAMMSLYVAPRRIHPIAGVVGISGALFGAESYPTELKSKPPICLIHGTADDVVPFPAMNLAESILKGNGFMVEAYPRPGLGHGIDEKGVEIISAFLKRTLML